MDKTLNDLWQAGNFPFDQSVIHLEDLIEIKKLHECLSKIFLFLKKHYQQYELFLNHDWHEHDGYIKNSIQVSWNEIENNLKDPQALFNSRDGDTYVRITAYPENLGFILRYYVLEEDEDDFYPGIWGIFDLTINQKYLNSVMELIKNIDVKCLISNAKEYFDKNYGG